MFRNAEGVGNCGLEFQRERTVQKESRNLHEDSLGFMLNIKISIHRMKLQDDEKTEDRTLINIVSGIA